MNSLEFKFDETIGSDQPDILDLPFSPTYSYLVCENDEDDEDREVDSLLFSSDESGSAIEASPSADDTDLSRPLKPTLASTPTHIHPETDTLTPAQRKQLKNKLSAQNFRARRKQMTLTLESELRTQKSENALLTERIAELEAERPKMPLKIKSAPDAEDGFVWVRVPRLANSDDEFTEAALVARREKLSLAIQTMLATPRAPEYTPLAYPYTQHVQPMISYYPYPPFAAQAYTYAPTNGYQVQPVQKKKFIKKPAKPVSEKDVHTVASKKEVGVEKEESVVKKVSMESIELQKRAQRVCVIEPVVGGSGVAVHARREVNAY